MKTNFKVKISLPSGKSIKLNELTNADYLTILKYCENLDIEGLNEFFDHLIFKNNLGLDIIDRFYTLLTIRMLFIDADLNFTDIKKSTIKFSITNILEKIDNFNNDFDKTINIDGFIIELGLPTAIYFRDIDDIYTSIIKEIKFNHNIIKFNELSQVYKDEILAQIPNILFTHISKYVTSISKQLQDFVIIDRNEIFNIEELNTNILSNEFMGFILSIFSSGLKNFLELMYVFANKLKIDGATFLTLSPLDTRVLINIYNKDIDDQNKELQKQNRE